MPMNTVEVEISVILKLPKNHYHVASGLVKIYDYENFDDYVSDTVRRDLDMLLDGGEPLYDQIHQKLTGKNSPYVQRVNAEYRPIHKRFKEILKEEKQAKISA